MKHQQPAGSARLSGVLGFIEWLGNKLPNPVFLFLGATAIVIAVSAIGDPMGWSVQPQRPRVVMEIVTDAAGKQVQRPKLGEEGRPVVELIDDGAPIRARSLATNDGVYWLVANIIRNFINFAR